MQIDPRDPASGAAITTVVRAAGPASTALAEAFLTAAFGLCLGGQVHLFIRRN